MQGTVGSLTTTYLKEFQPSTTAAVASSGGACSVASTAQSISVMMILLIVVGVLAALGLVFGIVLRIPQSLDSGFSNYSNYAEVRLMAEKVANIETKVEGMSGAQQA